MSKNGILSFVFEATNKSALIVIGRFDLGIEIRNKFQDV